MAVHRLVGARHQVVEQGGGVVARGSGACLDGDRLAVPVEHGRVQCALEVAHALVERQRQGAHPKHGEFVAGEPGGIVGGADVFLQDMADETQRGVAGGMAILVVDELEAVEIDESEDAGFAVARGVGEFALAPRLPGPFG